MRLGGGRDRADPATPTISTVRTGAPKTHAVALNSNVAPSAPPTLHLRSVLRECARYYLRRITCAGRWLKISTPANSEINVMLTIAARVLNATEVT